MAERQMDVQTTVSVLRRRWWLLVLFVAVAAVPTYLVSRSLPKVYEAETTLLVGLGLPGTSPDYQQLLASQQLSQTYSSIVTTGPLLEAVKQELDLEMTIDELRKSVYGDGARRIHPDHDHGLRQRPGPRRADRRCAGPGADLAQPVDLQQRPGGAADRHRPVGWRPAEHAAADLHIPIGDHPAGGARPAPPPRRPASWRHCGTSSPRSSRPMPPSLATPAAAMPTS